MSDFDPYLQWLGIRDSARPINHYRLLGLDLFESDPEVISMAVDRQVTHIRTYQSGPNGGMSQQIIIELARAGRCLLVAEKKVEYDAALRASMEPTALPTNTTDINPPPSAKQTNAHLSNQNFSPVVHPAVAPTVVSSDEPKIEVVADVDARAKTKKRESKQLVWTLFGWLTSALAAAGVAAWLINSGWLSNSKLSGGDELGKAVATGADQPGAGFENDPPKEKGTENGLAEIPLPPLDNSPLVNKGGPNSSNFEPKVAVVPGFNSKSEEISFDLENLSIYPQARSDALRLIGQIKREVPKGKTIRFELSATQGGSDDYSIVPEDGAILIGLAMTTTKDLAVHAIQPIFFDGLHADVGEAIPSIDSKSTSVIAKPGYAIGEIEISAIQPINCFRIKFMKISQKGLDLKDSYLSKWYGREVGPVRTISNERGLPIVGVYGRSDKIAGVAALGLIAMDASVKPVTNSGFFGSTNPTEAGSSEPGTTATNAEPIVKLPQLSARERSAAKKNLPEWIQVLIADANNVKAAMQVARQLVVDAKLEQDAILKYVVLEEAIQLSESVGDAETAIAALREIDRSFEIEFWKEAEKSIERAARNPQSLTELKFQQTLNELIEEARAKGLFDEARKLLADAIGFSKRAKDAESTSFYEAQRKEIQELERLFNGSVTAVAVLALNPDDPKANLDQGNFMFIFKNDIEGATTHWKKSSDEDLVSLANLEIDLDVSDAAQVVKLADTWYEMGNSNRTAQDRKCLARANELYSQALTSLNGLAKQSVIYKLAALKKILKN